MNTYSAPKVTIDLQEYTDLKIAASPTDVYQQSMEDFLNKIIVNANNPGFVFDFNNFSSQLNTSMQKFGLVISKVDGVFKISKTTN